MKYAVRDESGKFTKVTKIEPFVEIKHMTTIDNATQEPVTETLPVVTEEETVIRTKFQQMIDAVVGASKFAGSLDELKGRIETLTSALDAAEERTREAIRDRDQAIANAVDAKADATMARQAYDQVNAQMVAVVNERDQHKADSAIHLATANEHFANLEIERGAHSTTKSLLEAAREERDHFREAHGTLQAEFDLAKDHHEEYVANLVATIDNLTRENHGLHHKINGLEDANKAASDRLSRLQGRLDSIRHAVVD